MYKIFLFNFLDKKDRFCLQYSNGYNQINNNPSRLKLLKNKELFVVLLTITLQLHGNKLVKISRYAIVQKEDCIELYLVNSVVLGVKIIETSVSNSGIILVAYEYPADY